MTRLVKKKQNFKIGGRRYQKRFYYTHASLNRLTDRPTDGLTDRLTD